MTDKIETISVLFTQRNLSYNGATSSDQMNDIMDEIAADFSSFSDQWNNRLVVVTDALPNGSPDSTVDAFVNGLDGKNQYVDQDATAGSVYYKTASSRPMTVYEQLVDIYSEISDLSTDLTSQIGGLAPTAATVSILDAGGLYAATNVETALAEVMGQVDALTGAGGAADFSAVGENILFAADGTYNIGGPAADRPQHIYATGTVTADNLIAAATGEIYFTSKTKLSSPIDGILLVAANGGGGASVQMGEMTAPAGTANAGRLFCRDNGAGKTQLCSF